MGVELSTMSVPLVQTVRPETWTPPALSLIRVAAAAPVAVATPDFGAPAIVIACAVSVKEGFWKLIETRSDAMPLVPISRE